MEIHDKVQTALLIIFILAMLIGSFIVAWYSPVI